MKTMLRVLSLHCVLCGSIIAAPSIVESLTGGVHVVRDDSGQWGGASTGMTHQRDPGYEAKKVIDLSGVSDVTWGAVREMRLSAYFCVRDFSQHDLGVANGLDESFEIVVNGKVHPYPNNGGAPVYLDGKPTTMAWYDFALPKAEFVRGRNEVIFRKAATVPKPKTKADDYLYLGIDNTVAGGSSLLSSDGGKHWTTDKLNSIGARGEYMVRLYLLSQPGETDLAKLIDYAGTRRGKLADGPVILNEGNPEARIEWDGQRLDAQQPVAAVVETAGAVAFNYRWVDAAGALSKAASAKGPRCELSSGKLLTSGLVITAGKSPVTLQSVRLRGTLGYHPVPPPINMRPHIAAEPAGSPANRLPACRVAEDSAVLENATLRARFETRGHLMLVSLFNELAGAETIRSPETVNLFVVEIGEDRLSGARDFECRQVKAAGENGFTAALKLAEPPLSATLTGSIESEGLRLALTLTNDGGQPLDFKVAFPHLAGLALSKDPAADYYFYPKGGGIIADCAADIRQGYGDHQALYQVMDLFSPALGAGLSVRADDADGRYKVLALRKWLPGDLPSQTLTPLSPTKPEFTWSNSLDPIHGTSMAFEYLRRTRGPNKTFAPAQAVIAAHAGDWRVAMKDYAAWAHRVWKFRPWPSKLHNVVTMVASGWGQDILFKDGKYRTDFLKPNRDCIELMSWWEWSPLGPWRTPIDKIGEVLGASHEKLWKPYIVKDPVTGQRMFNNQPGDYDGYNERFGGLPAFRQAVADYKRTGKLITLYTDPIRCDDSTKLGQSRGKEWGVIGKDGEYVKNYDVWNMCHDVAGYRQWVAETMRRVLRETGADGIRLDEYGHQGWACFNGQHQHTFAEPGCTEWNREIAETCKLVRAAMDEVDPHSVLTTEHPGYDFLMPFLDGCITYDLTVQATPLRPLECNIQRFFFPECKAYELDHRGADGDCHKRFWNMVTAFGREYPPEMHSIFKDHADLLQSRDCEPLVPTLKPFVYANRFGSGAKTLWTLYNATGHTVDEPVLEVEVTKDQRLVELLGGEELASGRGRDGKGKQQVRLYLPRNGVACVARLPR